MEPELELERAVLGALLLLGNETPPPWAAQIEPEFFADKKHGQIMTAVADLLGRGEPVDALTASEVLRSWGMAGVAADVLTLEADAPTAVNLEYHAKLLCERAQKRDARQRLKRLIAQDAMPAPEVIDELTDIARNLEPRVGVGGLISMRELVPDVLRRIVAEHESPEKSLVIRTGLRDLDANLAMCPGELTIMGARPSMGKTSLATHIACEACRADLRAGLSGRGSVAIFSLEMSSRALIRRLLTSFSGVRAEDIPGAAARGDLAESANSLHALDVWIDDRPRLSVEAMRSALTRLRKVQLVVVDYLQLAKAPEAERHDLRIGAISKGLKSLAKEFQCHVIVLSQLNREVEKRSPPVPRLSDLRDSGNLEEDADNVLLLYRPYYYFPHADPTEVVVDVAKQRNGPTPTIQVRWTATKQQFRDW